MNLKLRYSIIIIDLSLENPKIQELCPLVPPTGKNLSLKISTIQELPGGKAPLVPLPGLCPGPTGGLQWPPDPLPKLLGTSYILESTSSLKK
jgi:hypothetical protein